MVSYLVAQEDWGLTAAVQAFSAAREPGIYKQDYLAELYRRYGDKEEESLPLAPERPPWCVLSSQALGLEVSSTESESEEEETGQRGGDEVSRNALEEVSRYSWYLSTKWSHCNPMQYQISREMLQIRNEKY